MKTSGSSIAARKLLTLSLSSMLATTTLAADYPSRPVELIVAASAGGGTDIVARAFAEAARTHLPQPFIVVNKPGASSAIGFADVANAKPDGYKVGVMSVNLVILPALGLMKVNADDFIPVARLNFDPAAITVRADSPWKTVEEFIADTKKKPGVMQVGNGGVGDIWHIAAAAVEDRTGAQFNHVPFQGAAPAVASLLGGHVDAITVSPGEVLQHVQAGKLRVLAIMADQRLGGTYASTPTLKERKIDLSIGVWRGLSVPKGTPLDVVQTLSKAVSATAAEPTFKEALARANLGESYADANGFKATIESDRESLKKVLAKLVIQK
ncbi:tripartite tricarboxylate transporter substrate binding protein [Variovorax sp. J22R133]|uniref:tripartite tricarboxylate transporter substrate binding protein n=1 Tax=Variovorax brevis TaxID=3053503 RepID=UPI00257705F4|nr:tripartite tricarboxylate transporter substrate binding protein [Variovorax sp. J22R133]MDM0111197.1 tripartite tricarboxylate transporter substrate binding protein [Variovorax sp. J22R133]